MTVGGLVLLPDTGPAKNPIFLLTKDEGWKTVLLFREITSGALAHVRIQRFRWQLKEEMSMRFRLPIGCLVLLLLIALPGGTASASYHTYRIAEVYSNPSGTVQFIELHEVLGLGGQNLLTLAPDIQSTTSDFTFPSNLPSINTANTYFLLGTAGYNAIPGAPHADYTIPNSFFNPAGDSLQYGSTGPDGIVDTTTFGALPTNPNQALIRQGTSGNTFTVGPAVANTFSNGGNFAVPEPGSIALMGLAGITLLRRRAR